METRARPSLPQLRRLPLELQIPVTLVELLKRTRALVEQGWTQQAPARNRQGGPVLPTAPTAIRFCLSGALQRACAEALGPLDVTSRPPFRDCFARLEDQIHARYKQAEGCPTLQVWNDLPSRRKSEVLALIEETIACLK